MAGKKITFFIFTAFILGTMALIYVHLIFSKNNDQLIKGNEKLMDEVMVNSQLKNLEKSIVSIESAVRGAVAINDPTLFKGLDKNISEAETNLNQLQNISDDDSSAELIDVLDSLVQHKIEYNRRVLDTFHQYGKKAAEIVLAGNYGVRLTDSIVSTIHNIDNGRKKHFTLATVTIEKSSKKAQQFISVLILSVLIGGAILFWYIIITMRKQGQLITQLNISEKKVRESAQIKEKFLANMSHEIRTPMNAILGYANLLQRKKLDDESKEFVQTILKSGENLLTIINDILDLSKIEAGMMRIEAVPFSIRGLTHSVKSIFSEKAKEKNLQLLCWVDQTVPDTLKGDPVRLTQILINLIGNALKFTSSGNIGIHITNTGIKDEMINLGITIIDTGIGIEEENLKQVFERFQQADDAVTRKYGGTGLGLSIVNDLVQLQNGSIEVESKPGIGTTFKIIIPYKITTEKKSSIDAESSENATINDFTNALILVVEDNEINQTLIKHLFKSWGLSFDMANNGKDAVGILKTNKYNLVIMDIQMPEMDGYTATKIIREQLKLEIPIIAMTAHALPGEKEKCLSYGMNEYITKPFREEKLHQLISKFLNTSITKYSSINYVDLDTVNSYHFIDLKYMKDISGGNKEYEKTVTEQFLESIPEDLEQLEILYKNKNISQLRQLAHNMKTTVSVMGLNKILEPHLDALEYENLNTSKMQMQLAAVKLICNSALSEVQQFYSTL